MAVNLQGDLRRLQERYAQLRVLLDQEIRKNQELKEEIQNNNKIIEELAHKVKELSIPVITTEVVAEIVSEPETTEVPKTRKTKKWTTPTASDTPADIV